MKLGKPGCHSHHCCCDPEHTVIRIFPGILKKGPSFPFYFSQNIKRNISESLSGNGETQLPAGFHHRQPSTLTLKTSDYSRLCEGREINKARVDSTRTDYFLDERRDPGGRR